MLLEVSIGEAIDKYSILEIKQEYISNEERLQNIKTEYENLRAFCEPLKIKYPLLYRLIVYINKEIWHKTNEIKALEVTAYEYSVKAKSIFEYNDKRFRLKNLFNILESSVLKEQKSYSANTIKIYITSLKECIRHLPILNSLILDYDTIQVVSPCNINISKLYNWPCVMYETDPCSSVLLSSIKILYDTKYFELEPIYYLAGGMMGDYIHMLGVVYEKYIQTGRKGVVYLTNNYDKFRLGLDVAYKDLKELMVLQNYIFEFKIHEGENYDINLNSWRCSPLLYNANWYEIYKKEYDVEWSTSKYIEVPIDETYTNTVVFVSSIVRWNENINYSQLLNKYNMPKLFICFNIEEYNHFTERTRITIPVKVMSNIYEMAVCINSCKLFIGNLSSPLAIAQAVWKDRIGLAVDAKDDKRHVMYMEDIWSNCTWIFENNDLDKIKIHNLYITYNNSNHCDGAGAQLQRIYSAYILSKYYDIGYVHSPIKKLGNYGLKCLEDKKEDLEQLDTFNSLFNLKNNLLAFDEIYSYKDVTAQMINEYKYIANTHNKKILLKVELPVFELDRCDAARELCKCNSFNWVKEELSIPLNIAIHIRLGDAMILAPERIIPIIHYKNIIHSLKIRYLSAVIHIYTEVPTKKQVITSEFREDMTNINYELDPTKSEINELNEIDGIVWHINENPVQSFIDLCNADVLVTAKSSFSYLAALLNKKQNIYYIPFWHKPCANWNIIHL